MTLAGRTDRLYKDLTASERAILVLRAWKRGEREDSKVRILMPKEQAREFNRLIAIMTAVNMRMGQYVVELEHSAELLRVELDWLSALDLWSHDIAYLGLLVEGHIPWPITQSEHQALVNAERNRLAPVGELAGVLVEQRGVAANERGLRALVADGTLRGKRTREGVLVEVGGFYDWLGEPAPLWPDWGLTFDVRPDEQREAVDCGREQIAEIREALASHPVLQLRRRLAAKEGCTPTEVSFDPFQRIVALRAMTAAVRWRELRAVEVHFQLVADREFDGEDAALPLVRETIDATKAMLEAVRKTLGALGETFEFEEPSEEDRAEIRKIYEKSVELES